jgi:2,3-dihydroxyethylbenzene 1,2-dioxygenase
MAEKIRKAGIDFRLGTAEEAAERRVLGLLKMVDPAGNRTEIFWGPQVDRYKPFHPGRPMFGRFVTGDQGMGHFVLDQSHPEASIRFYETLGFVGSVEMEISLPNNGVVKPAFFHLNDRQHSLAFAPAPAGKHIHHMMVQYTNLKDLGRAHDLVRARKIPVAMQLGMHSNDEQLSFYSGNPSGWTWELGWGGRQALTQQEYDTRDIFGHAPEADGFGLDLPMNG